MSAISNALVSMWAKSKEHLSEDELQDMSDLSDTAQFAANNLRQVVEGIACLVLADQKAGTFQTADSVSMLLFSIASQIDLIDGLIQVGTEAECRLSEMQTGASEGQSEESQKKAKLVRDVGSRIRKYRKLSGLTQLEAAKQLGKGDRS